MQKEIKIKAHDGKVIYGTLTVAKKPAEKLIIFVHGMTSSSYEPKYYNAARFFRGKGFNSFFFEQYPGGKERARRFIDTTTSIHALDLEAVITFFKKKYKKLYLITHSWGGPVALLADWSAVAAVVLWDPSVDYKFKEGKSFSFDKRIDAYLSDWGVQTVIGKEWVAGARALPDPENLGARASKPTKIISAKVGNGHKAKRLMKNMQVPTAYHYMAKASHNFPEWGAEEELFKETLDWLKRW